jgi:gliding motility-associated-like protein
MNIFNTTLILNRFRWIILASLLSFIGLNAVQAQVSIEFPKRTASPGDTVCLEARISDFTNIQRFEFQISWDSTVMDLHSIIPTKALPNLVADASNFLQIGDGTLNFKWTSTNLTDGFTIENDSVVVFTLCFKIQPGTYGLAAGININQNPATRVVIRPTDGRLLNIPLNYVRRGRVNVNVPSYAPLSINVGSTDISIGKRGCVEVTTKDFKSITKLNFGLGWDETKVKLDTIQDFGFTALTKQNFKTTVNTLILDWKSLGGVSLADGKTLFKMCFSPIVNQDVQVPLKFLPNPASVINIYSNPTSTEVELKTTEGALNIVKNAISAAPLVLTLSQKTANVGEEVCLGMTVENFNDIVAANATLQWNKATLAFKSLEIVEQKIKIDFNIGNALSAGSLPFLLTSKTTAGTTLPDKTVLANICYTVLAGSGATTGVDFTPDFGAKNNLQTIEMTPKSGGVKILALPATQPKFALRDTSTTNGATLCMNVQTLNFLEINELGYTLAWDTLVMRFKNVSNFGLTNLTAANFDMSQTNKGTLTLKWKNGIKGTTILGRKTFFTLCFDIVGLSGSFSTLKMLPNATALNVNEPTNELGIDFPSIKIQVAQAININNPVITNAGCTIGGSIKVVASGGKAPYIYTWQDGTKTDFFQNLAKGTYKLTVTDANNSKEFFSFMVDASTDKPRAIAVTETPIDCKTKQATLNALASTQAKNIVYTWTTPNGKFVSGTNTLQPIVSSAGVYVLQVRNSTNNCEDTISIFVRNKVIKASAQVIDNQQISCKDTIAMIDGSASSGENISYEWLASNGKTINNTPKITVKTGGNYTLKVRNAQGCEDVTNIKVLADTLAPKAIALAKNTLNCRDTSTILESIGSSAGTQYAYQWATTTGKLGGLITSINNKALKGGNYSLKITNQLNSCSAIAKITVVADTIQPVTRIAQPKILTCKDSIILLDAKTSSQGAQYTTEWATIDGKFLTKPTALIANAIKAGAYSLKITNTKNFCTNTFITKISEDRPLPIVKAIDKGSINCKDSVAMVDGTGSSVGAPWMHEWTTKDGKIKSGSNALIATIEKAGNYTLKVSDESTGCAAFVTIIAFSDTIAPKIRIKQPTSLSCANNQVVLDATETGAVPFKFDWQTTKEGRIAFGAENAKAIVDKIGTYTLKVTDTENFCTSQKIINVIGDFEKPIADAGSTLEMPCDKTQITLSATASSKGSDIRYRWDTKNGKIIDGKNTAQLTIGQEGKYTLLVENIKNGCFDADTVVIASEKELSRAYAGLDRTICGDTVQLQAIILNGNITGTWSALSKMPLIETPSSAITSARKLEAGDNFFLWTVSKGRCKRYDTDTLVVRRIVPPTMNADIFDLKPKSNVVFGDVLNNDLFSEDPASNQKLQFKWLNIPATGQFKAGDANGKFQFTMPLGSLSDVRWAYSICHPVCLSICDSVSVRINNQNTTIVVANTITPNGDGANDSFVIDELLNNPNAYPNSEIVIINRWGDEVFASKPYNNDWAGNNNNGQPLPTGTYYYILRMDNSKGLILKGDITVLR